MRHSTSKLQQRQPGTSKTFGHAMRQGKVETPFKHAAAHKGRGYGRGRKR